MSKRDWINPTAEQVPFDSPEFQSDNIHDAIHEIKGSASASFVYGRNASWTGWSYLRVPGQVPSNRASGVIFINGALLRKIAFGQEAWNNNNIGQARIRIIQHQGDFQNPVTIADVTVPSPVRSHIFNINSNIVIPYGSHIAVRVRSVNGISVKNVVVSLDFIGQV